MIKVSIPFISGQCVIKQIKTSPMYLGFNPLYIGSMCNYKPYIMVVHSEYGFNPLYIGSMCNGATVMGRQTQPLFQSPLYRVNV